MREKESSGCVYNPYQVITRFRTNETHRERLAGELLEEILRGTLPVADLVLSVLVLPDKPLVWVGRNTQSRSHDAINFLHQLLLLGAEGGNDRLLLNMGAAEGVSQCPDNKSMLAKFGLENSIERSRERRVGRFRVHSLRNDTVGFDQVDNHVPLATVADKIAREMVDETVVNRKVCILNHKLQVVVGLVQFVPEEEVRLHMNQTRNEL